MKKIIVILVILVSAISGFSQKKTHQQKTLHRNAEKYFNRFQLVEAAYNYKKILNKNSQDSIARNVWRLGIKSSTFMNRNDLLLGVINMKIRLQ